MQTLTNMTKLARNEALPGKNTATRETSKCISYEVYFYFNTNKRDTENALVSFKLYFTYI